MEGRVRIRQAAVFAQAAINIFDVDDGIVDHLADGDGEATERHRVEAEAHLLRSDHRGEQRERNRDTGNGGGAQIKEKKKEHYDNEHCADVKRVAHVADGDLNEVGGAQNVRMDDDALGFEIGPQAVERLVNGARDGESIRAVGGVDDDADAALASNGSCTECWRG